MDLLKKLEERIAPRLMAVVRLAGETAASRGQALYLVGGAVRDLLLGRINIDLDLVVEGDALELAAHLSGKLGAKLVAHTRFGTAKVLCSGFFLDLVTARSETYAASGALPTVKPGSITDDLARRDFTINAMALGLSAPHLGELIDPFGGQADLEKRLVRVLHEKSFIDDATRLFRAIRYEQRLGFELEERTEALARRDVPYLEAISGDRLRHEVELVLAETGPERILRRAGELGILAWLDPHLRGDGWLVEKFRQARELFQPKQPPMSVYLALLVWPFNLEETGRLTSRLNLPGKVARVMRDAVRLKNQSSAFSPGMKNSEVYYVLSRLLPYAIQVNIIALENPAAVGYMRLFLEQLRYVKVETAGARLKSLGAPQGPALGKILHQLHMAKLDGLVKSGDEEETMAMELIRETGNRQQATGNRQ